MFTNLMFKAEPYYYMILMTYMFIFFYNSAFKLREAELKGMVFKCHVLEKHVWRLKFFSCFALSLESQYESTSAKIQI